MTFRSMAATKRFLTIASAAALVVGVASTSIAVDFASPAGATSNHHDIAPSASGLSTLKREQKALSQLGQKTVKHHQEKRAALATREGMTRTHANYAKPMASQQAVPLGAAPQIGVTLATFVVNTTTDSTIATGNYQTGTYKNCETEGSSGYVDKCSLTEAVETVDHIEYQTTAGPFAISIPSGTYSLSAQTEPTGYELDVTAPYGVVITGAGQTQTIIKATNASRVMAMSENVGSSDATLATLTVETGGGGGIGGCTNDYLAGNIYECSRSDSLVLDHVTVKNGTATFGGGAIAEYGSLWILNSTLEENSAVITTFTGVTSNVYGGALYIGGSATLTNDTLVDNGISVTSGSSAEGGAIYVNTHAALSVANSTFSTNIVATRDFTASGGAIGVGNITTLDSTKSCTKPLVSEVTTSTVPAFTVTKIVFRGACLTLVTTISLQTSNVNLTTISAVLLTNLSYTGSGTTLTATIPSLSNNLYYFLLTYTYQTVSKREILEQSIRVKGGCTAIPLRRSSSPACGEPAIARKNSGSNSLASPRTTIGSGGYLSVRSSTFTNNAAYDLDATTTARGGAIFCLASCNSISTSTFQSNSDEGYFAAGGAVDVVFSSVDFENDLFTANVAAAIPQTGCTFYCTRPATFPTAAGGAIGAQSSSISLANVTARNNLVTSVSLGFGGAISLNIWSFCVTDAYHCTKDTPILVGAKGTAATIVHSTLSGNTAHGPIMFGGAFFALATDGLITIKGTNFATDIATATGQNESDGGAAFTLPYLYTDTGTDTLFYSEISAKSSSVLYQDDSFTNDSASFGGAVGLFGDGTVVGDVFAHNEATDEGGGIIIYPISYALVTSTSVTQNSAPWGGGIMFYGVSALAPSRAKVANSTISTNTGEEAGGGIGALDARLTFEYDTVTGNSASEGGGFGDMVDLFGNTESSSIIGSVIAGNIQNGKFTTSTLGSFTDCDVQGGAKIVNQGGNYFGSFTPSLASRRCTTTVTNSYQGDSPLLAPLADNGGVGLTRMPMPGSPLLGAGGSICPASDEVGSSRPHSGCTSGALEETVGAGYTSVAADGGVFAFPSTLFHGSTGAISLNQPVVGMASTPDGKGYWLVAKDGGVFTFGNAHYYGSLPGSGVNVGNIVGIVATPTGEGYWLVGANGGVYSYGDAGYEGSLPGSGVSASNIVGIAAHGSDGYWLVGANGAVYAYGSASYKGGANTLLLNKEIVGIASDPGQEGYWLVGNDGGIFGFGSAATKFYGSMGASSLNAPIVGIASTNDGAGYWLVGADGGIFSYGDAQFEGSTGSMTLNKPIVGIA